MKSSLLLLTASLGLATAGCEWVALGIALSDDDDCMDCCDGCWDEGPPPVEAVPPTFDFEIADWPPIGPSGTVTIHASADNGLNAATFFFNNTVTKVFDGSEWSPTTSGSLSATGDDLGEGLGHLEVEVEGWDGATARRGVDGLLVDLTPPSAYFDRTVYPATGEMQFWMADAWVVSRCVLTVGAATFEEALPPGYPATLGAEWDYSLVTVPLATLPIGAHTATLEVWDAAGNYAVLDVPLTIDGIAPEAGITQPEEGAVLDGTFQLTVTATDDMPLPIALEISVGGALVATGSSPETTITLSTSDFPAGANEISVVAVDEAGNRSPAIVRNVFFGTEAPPEPAPE